MLRRIDLFMPPRSQYGVLHHFTHKLAEALKRCGISCRILEAEYYNPAPFIDALMSDPPDCTLSFNGLLPDEKGRFFCDMIGIPHVACIVDSANLFIPLIQSPLTVIACADRFSCDFFRGLKCKNVLFMPHGVEKELAPDESIERCRDVTLLSSLIDYEALQEGWKERYDSAVVAAMNEAVEVTLSDTTTSYVQALVDGVDRQMELSYTLDPSKIDFISVMDDIERYLKGRSRVDLVRAIRDAHIDIYGTAEGKNSWEKYLSDSGVDYTLHEPVPYLQALEIFKESKILLNSSPWMKGGAHERIFYGLASEALVVTSENSFIADCFQNDKNIFLYQTGDLEGVNERIIEYLSDDEKRRAVAKEGRCEVMKHHTWDCRAKQLIEELDPIIAELKEGAAKRGESKEEQ